MTAPADTRLLLANTHSGFLIRIVGRGTMYGSPKFREVAEVCLADEEASVVVDLAACEYLDSTFLGCFVDLHRRFGGRESQRFTLAAPEAHCKLLLGPTHLDQVLCITDSAPVAISSFETMTIRRVSKQQLGQHCLSSHRQLATIDGPQQNAFAAVVNRLEKDVRG